VVARYVDENALALDGGLVDDEPMQSVPTPTEVLVRSAVGQPGP
jgi:hypothetical protein